MEKSEAPENPARETKENLLVPLLILTFLVCAWLVYAYINTSWFEALDQVIAWMQNPTITYSPLQIEGLPWAFLATIEVLILGFGCSYLLLEKEKDTVIKFITAIGLGVGLTGLISIILGIFGVLYQLPINSAILLLIGVSLSALIYKKRVKDKSSPRLFFTPKFLFPKFRLPPNLKFWLPACIVIGVIFFFSFYHALFTVIVHWDALVYHAAMANIMYNEHAIPIITGPSIGIEMSANFPPLFSALGAYYYIQIGSIQDIYLRMIAPVMGLLTVIATYKIGELVAGKKFGLISALLLSITPLFFRYSIYATSYSALTFFCTVTILFLLLAIVKGDTKYWIGSGLFYGFATLTSYIALYLAPFLLVALVAYFAAKKNSFKVNIKKATILILSAVVIGGVWYLRNLILVGNPIYPNAYTVLGGLNLDPLITQTTFNGIKLSATISFFGGQVSSLDQVMIFLTYRTSFPAVSLFTVLALVLFPTIKNKKLWLIAVWPLTLAILILSGISWGFPRHMVLAMPGFALLSAIPIIKALEMCKKFDSISSEITLRHINSRLPPIRKSNFIRLGLVVILLFAFIFPSLTLVMGGKVWAENLKDEVPVDYLWFLKNPNADTWNAVSQLYPEAIAWQYINANLSAGEKVATVENRIYYVKNCSNDYFFYLDGWEARELYNITDPDLMVQFLRNENVKFVIDVTWAREHGHFDVLPLSKYLGSPSPYFPTIFNNASNPAIYNVGPFETPITNGSITTISINQIGWCEVQTINGVQTQSVIAGNDLARLYVATPNLTSVSITYLDVGNEEVAINVRNPNSLDWINGYAVIQKTDTGKWKNYEVFAPMIDRGFVELALHAYHENFTVRKIDATPFQSEGRVAVSSTNSTLSMKIINTTVPATSTVYLPMLNQSEILQINATSNGQPIGIELYEGVFQPWETTNWWLNHELVTRSPNSIVNGQVNPSLVWKIEKSGSYTLVIVLRDSYSEDAKVDLQIWGSTSSGGSIK